MRSGNCAECRHSRMRVDDIRPESLYDIAKVLDARPEDFRISIKEIDLAIGNCGGLELVDVTRPIRQAFALAAGYNEQVVSKSLKRSGQSNDRVACSTPHEW